MSEPPDPVSATSAVRVRGLLVELHRTRATGRLDVVLESGTTLRCWVMFGVPTSVESGPTKGDAVILATLDDVVRSSSFDQSAEIPADENVVAPLSQILDAWDRGERIALSSHQQQEQGIWGMEAEFEPEVEPGHWEGTRRELIRLVDDRLGNRGTRIRRVLEHAEPTERGLKAAVASIRSIRRPLVRQSAIVELADAMEIRIRDLSVPPPAAPHNESRWSEWGTGLGCLVSVVVFAGLFTPFWRWSALVYGVLLLMVVAAGIAAFVRSRSR